MKIAFVGLGNMGGGMAANLVKAGHEVRAFDLAEAALERARDHGCATFGTVREAVQGVDAVVTMLPNGTIVKSVYTADVIGHAPTAALLLDCSTIDVATARDVACAALAAGYATVDAPVSGGIAAANGGTLTFMVGGEVGDFARAEPILAAMGKAVIHAGASGAGQAAKICNNMLLGASMVATCETFKLAERLGLDLQTFYDISSKASGQCWSMTSYCPVPGIGPQTPADNGYQGGFATALMLKDLKLAMAAAEAAGAPVPMGHRAEELSHLASCVIVHLPGDATLPERLPNASVQEAWHFRFHGRKFATPKCPRVCAIASASPKTCRRQACLKPGWHSRSGAIGLR